MPDAKTPGPSPTAYPARHFGEFAPATKTRPTSARAVTPQRNGKARLNLQTGASISVFPTTDASPANRFSAKPRGGSPVDRPVTSSGSRDAAPPTNADSKNG